MSRTFYGWDKVQNPVICSVSHRLSVCVCVNIYLTSAHAQSGSKDVYIAQRQ